MQVYLREVTLTETYLRDMTRGLTYTRIAGINTSQEQLRKTFVRKSEFHININCFKKAMYRINQIQGNSVFETPIVDSCSGRFFFAKQRLIQLSPTVILINISIRVWKGGSGSRVTG